MKFSTGAINSMLSDEVALQSMEASCLSFKTGDRTALMEIIITCARFQAVIPEWAVDELFSLDDKIALGEATDLNKFFGFTKPTKNEIKKNKVLKKSVTLQLS